MSKSVAKLASAEDSDLHSEIAATVKQFNSEISEDNPVSPYLSAYNQMFRAFDDAYICNQKLVKFCQEMNSIIIMNAAKINDILTCSSNDTESLEDLRNEFKQAQSTLKTSLINEQAARKEMKELRDELLEMRDLLTSRGNTDTTAKDIVVLQSEIDSGNIEIKGIQSEIDSARLVLESKTADLEHIMSELHRSENEIVGSDDLVKQSAQTTEDTRQEIVDCEALIVSLSDQEEANRSKVVEMREKCDLSARKVQDLGVHLASLQQEGSAVKARVAKLPKKLREQKLMTESHHDEESTIRKRMEKLANQEEEYAIHGKQVDAEVERLTREYTQVMALKKKLHDEKKQLKDRLQELRDMVVTKQLAATKSESEKHLEVRMISAAKVELSNDRVAVHNASREAHEVEGQQARLISETVSKKQGIQGLKVAGARISEEIAQKTNETSDVEQRTEEMNIIADRTKAANDEAMQDLTRVRAKVAHQEELTQKLREERNGFKRQAEFCAAEHQEMQGQYTQVVRSIESMTYRIDKIVETMKKNRERKQEMINAIESLEKMEKSCKEGISNTEKVIQRLETEQVYLWRIFDEAQHNQEQQQRDFQVLKGNLAMLQGQLSIKSRHLEKLQSDIITENRLLEKCRELFRDKMDEINTLTNELNKKSAKTAELEKKRENLAKLELEYRYTFQEYEIEHMRKMALYQEYATPMNVSQFMLERAVDPQKVLQIQYMKKLSGEINQADLKLQRLCAKRDKLKKKSQDLIDKTTDLTVNDVKNRIARYSDDLRRKNLEIEEIKAIVEGNKSGVLAQKDKAISARVMVSYRKNHTATLRRNNETLRKSDDDDYFITEPPTTIVPSCSCGFKVRPPPGVPELAFKTEDLQIVSASSTTPRTQRIARVTPRIKVPAMNTPRAYLKRRALNNWA